RSSVLARARPQRPTLSPYTTLFRSLPVAADADAPRAGMQTFARQHDPRLREFFVEASHFGEKFLAGHFARFRGGGRFHQNHDAQDRKSTRLNSSHVKISYAVFCLKK